MLNTGIVIQGKAFDRTGHEPRLNIADRNSWIENTVGKTDV